VRKYILYLEILLVCEDDACATGTNFSAHVDMYNASSNSWTSHPSGITQARGDLAAASLPSGLVFFAGGISGSAHRVCFCSAFGVHFGVVVLPIFYWQI
jgi:hypothetical protein